MRLTLRIGRKEFYFWIGKKYAPPKPKARRHPAMVRGLGDADSVDVTRFH